MQVLLTKRGQPLKGRGYEAVRRAGRRPDTELEGRPFRSQRAWQLGKGGLPLPRCARATGKGMAVQEIPVWAVRESNNAGSFDLVRPAPHFAQDDRVLAGNDTDSILMKKLQEASFHGTFATRSFLDGGAGGAVFAGGGEALSDAVGGEPDDPEARARARRAAV